MNAEDIRKALTRVSHEILERVPPDQSLVLVGLHTRGVPLAHRIANQIEHIELESTADFFDIFVEGCKFNPMKMLDTHTPK